MPKGVIPCKGRWARYKYQNPRILCDGARGGAGDNDESIVVEIVEYDVIAVGVRRKAQSMSVGNVGSTGESRPCL